MCLIRSMFQLDLFEAQKSLAPPPRMAMAEIVRRIAAHSARPRYTFMVLDLIAKVARPNGQAGPLVRDGHAMVPIREWLASAIAPSAGRHHHRRATADRVKAALAQAGALPADPVDAERAVEREVEERVLGSGMTAVSRAVSELVSAGLLKRYGFASRAR